MLWFTLEMLSVILINPHNIKLLSPQKVGAGSSARLERLTDNRKVGSSNPPRPTISTLLKYFDVDFYLSPSESSSPLHIDLENKGDFCFCPSDFGLEIQIFIP